jgi:large subunit ribosomal protein L13
MKTYQPKAKEIKRDWHLIDAQGQILGRLASEVAKLLMGKHKPIYVPHLDMGDFVVVTNAQKIKVTGRKEKQKVYQKHSGYPGGFKEVAFLKLKKEQPAKIIQLAVRRMLPDNRLRDKRMTRLKVFASETHPYKNKFKDAKKT